MWLKEQKFSVGDDLNAVDPNDKLSAAEDGADIDNQRSGIPSERREPVFTCDIDEKRGVLRLRRGKWAGRNWTVQLHCCENPFCGCVNVDFHCVDADRDPPEHAERASFGLDVMKRKVTPEDGRENADYAPDFAKAAVAEFGEEDWQSLYRFLVETKRNIVRTMDVTKLTLPDSLADFPEDGSLVGFSEIFPFADCFEFELDGDLWAVDDQYCINPDCDCREVALSFCQVITSQDISATAKAQVPVPAARYNYKRNKIEPEQKPASDQPSLAALMQALKKAHPSFVKNVKLRHEQLKTVYLRTVLGQEASDNTFSLSKTFRRDEPKFGRNDPCPCGSGKKYKKCCAR